MSLQCPYSGVGRERGSGPVTPYHQPPGIQRRCHSPPRLQPRLHIARVEIRALVCQPSYKKKSREIIAPYKYQLSDPYNISLIDTANLSAPLDRDRLHVPVGGLVML